nr:sulfatase-like hydrolase/transferase [Lachnospiraceae bacterium]
GFRDMKFLEHFEKKDPEIVRKYISDSSFTKAIIEEVEMRSEKKPVFAFNVTMQNHASYAEEYDNLKKDVKITDEKKAAHTDDLETYLSLLKLSDAAFKEMIEHYERSDKKTLVLFFGDHQPATVNFEQVFMNLGTDRHDLSDDTVWDTYKVPFVIWANYEIEEERDVKTSVNYLGNLMLKAAGIPLNGYRAFTDELSKKAPVVTAIRTEDSDGNSENLSKTHIDLSEYKMLQYYELFDREIK